MGFWVAISLSITSPSEWNPLKKAFKRYRSWGFRTLWYYSYWQHLISLSSILTLKYFGFVKIAMKCRQVKTTAIRVCWNKLNIVRNLFYNKNKMNPKIKFEIVLQGSWVKYYRQSESIKKKWTRERDGKIRASATQNLFPTQEIPKWNHFRAGFLRLSRVPQE